ncbi:hypothetical protein O4H49_05835 [Kiloniella laminariae]|uniref:Uncharacterized protein n=1 Tax=Kiloniella laminariae TaxID=454162 RepID=A0ABT4LJX2_9PROT|nr:hypothetical protein [Kiloniella laminariae]MCZ4280287.1 hypothetical protein [Kiloniella laminariae]
MVGLRLQTKGILDLGAQVVKTGSEMPTAALDVARNRIIVSEKLHKA